MADDKKQFEEKKYAILSRDSIKSHAESVGHEISDEVSALLAEDVVYRVREATMNAFQFMRHAKRRKLTTEDFNKGLKNSDVQPLLGYSQPSKIAFRHTRESELFFPEENDVDLATSAQKSQPVRQPGTTTIKAYWLAVEGIPKSSLLGSSHTIKGSNKSNPAVSEDLLAYYDNMTKAILGYDEKVVKHAFSDLQKNTKIAPLLPYFVNFVNNGVKTVSHDISQLIKLLHTVKALVSNKSLYLEPKPYLDLLVQTVLYCLLEPLAASINPLNDHWALRDYAARLLAQITREWTTPVNQLKRHNISALREVFYDTGRQFCSHYGAVIGIFAFGPKAIERVLLPNLPRYWIHLQRPTSATADSQKVIGALMMAVERIINLRGNELLYPPLTPSTEEPEDPNDTLTGLDDLALYSSVTALPASVPVIASGGTAPPTDGTDPATSTPIKPGIHFPHLDLLGPVLELPDNTKETPVTASTEQESELVGTVLTLPETSTPQAEHQSLSELYKQVAEYFGDSLTTRLPVHHRVRDLYVRRQQLPVVSLADPDSQKSGEELLQVFLNVTHKHDDSENVDMKSENQSCDPTPDDIEMDEADEKSEHSSRSEHSDDSTYIDSNLTVKTVVDPSSAGIKLTFRKMPRNEPPLPPPPPPIPEPAPVVKVRRKYADEEVFEREEFCPPHLATTFVFVYAGMVQKSQPKKRRERTIFDDSHAQWSGTLLMIANKMYGRRKGSPKESNRRLHLHSSSLHNIL